MADCDDTKFNELRALYEQMKTNNPVHGGEKWRWAYYNLEKAFDGPEIRKAVMVLYEHAVRLVGSVGDEETEIERECIVRSLVKSVSEWDVLDHRAGVFHESERNVIASGVETHKADPEWLEAVYHQWSKT